MKPQQILITGLLPDSLWLSLSYMIYPLTLGIGFGLFYLMTTAGYSLRLSSYTVIILTALIISLLEWLCPETSNWIPDNNELKTDAMYMVVVQLLLPRFLSLVFILSVASPLQSYLPLMTHLWPQHWSTIAQALLMLLIADFFSYWFHRAAHSNRWLWKLHAIHHSVDKLYWLNVGRFHPLEKLFQLFLTSLPFILLGVNEMVLAIYLVFYSINGFFQHCNIKLHYGPLNYLISSTELHRWHHDLNHAISAHNFGNNLSIWDLLFGTWLLPSTRRPVELGLSNRYYPTDFYAQLKIPFDNVFHTDGSLSFGLHLGRKIMTKLLMLLIKCFYLRPLLKSTEQPEKTQWQWLNKLVVNNHHTQFGKQHGFASINSYQDFAASVPIQDYESLRPYIEIQQQNGSKQLTEKQPLLYAVTSGTSGQPKYIPVLAQTLKQYRQEQAMFSLIQFQSRPQGFGGKTLALVSPPIEGRLNNGIAFGSVSGHIYQLMPWIFRSRHLIPVEVFSITDYDLKYKIIARLALAESNITCLASANPSSFLRLLEVFRQHSVELIDSVASGQLTLPETVNPKTRKLINKLLEPDTKRADRLRYLVAADKTDYCNLWPKIRTVSTWTGGSCSIALNNLKQQLPVKARIQDLGYIASELRITLPVPSRGNVGLPIINHHFFEFIKRSDRETGNNTTLLIDQLENHQEYYIIITTSNGLYRYLMNDIVRVDGFMGQTPLLVFVRKGLGVTNITGEKIYENHIIEAVTRIQDEHKLQIPFYLMLADQHSARYHLYLEITETNSHDSQKLAYLIDNALSSTNIEYHQKRASLRLKALQLSLLKPGTADAFKRFYLWQGQREAQFKPRILQYLKECQFPVTQFCQDSNNKLSDNQVQVSDKCGEKNENQ